MISENFDRFCDEVLTLIEYDETSLLNWGFIEIENDLSRRLEAILERLPPAFAQDWQEYQEQGKTLGHIFENLQDRLLIFETREGYSRSRYAETVRLLYLLRQRFAKDDWATAGRLVSDIRLQPQRRRYPKRFITAEELIESLSETNISMLRAGALRQLLPDRNGIPFTLAKFQQEAIQIQFRLLSEQHENGIVIGAGTGAGKTKAFYLPALAWLAEYISNQAHVAIIAIYPRVELLKDQFSEALSETSRLNEYLRGQGKRPISIGCYYGDTPESVNELANEKRSWASPYFSCPNCNHKLEWTSENIKAAQEDDNYAILTCPKCEYETDAQHILLTRSQMRKRPPDILFTTTEMLNRRLSRVPDHKLFGIGTKPPRLMLLDEIHTYEGITGANVAYLLRRWRKACGYTERFTKNKLCVVGLSATLNQAPGFFSKLTGIPSYRIQYISPEDEELEEEGIEYNLVLKGDPASGTALLSTSIQTAMLMTRILEPLRSDRITFAPKVFAFGNRLDTINRWYDNQNDAESQHLSSLRLLGDEYSSEQKLLLDRMGQDWRICERIGNPLNQKLEIDRVSSQDRGVKPSAKLVIASPSLEVGFNDSRVGAVLQHQTPYSMASFLQRKGRAGRSRATRPWTVVITSAYGRDRQAFQNAERLFNPTLLPNYLPLENYYVRKIHAAYTLMDWLALRLKNTEADVWKLLASASFNYKGLRDKLIKDLQALLTNKSVQTDYETYLTSALGLNPHEDEAIIHSLLWGEPRPIFLDLVPSLLRQLEQTWQIVLHSDNGLEVRELGKSQKSSYPIPEYVPAALFSDLNLPELRVDIAGETKTEPMIQTFEEIVPGKVTKRFKNEEVWLKLDTASNTVSIFDLDAEFDNLPRKMQANGNEYLVYRPLAYKLENIPDNLAATSTAFAIWSSEFKPQKLNGDTATPFLLNLQYASLWQSVIEEVQAYLQALGTTIQVTRGMTGVEVSHLSSKGSRLQKTISFHNQKGTEPISQATAIGYNLAADGICFKYKSLEILKLKRNEEWAKLRSTMRPLFYFYRLTQDGYLSEFNSFEINWLWQVIRSSLVEIAISGNKSLFEAKTILDKEYRQSIETTLRTIFQAQSDDDDVTGRKAQDIFAKMLESKTKQRLLYHLDVLWETEPEGMDAWIELQYASTIGATVFHAISNLISDVNDEDLHLDIEPDKNQFWITEAIGGGIGLIAKIVEVIAQYPHRFELRLLDSMRHCPREQLAFQMDALALLIQNKKKELLEDFSEIREKHDFVSLTEAKSSLIKSLETNGIPANRELIVTINSKFLRPNSNPDTDDLIVNLLRVWQDEKRRLEHDIDLRVFAVAANRNEIVSEQLNDILRRIGNVEQISENHRFNLLQSMLWTSCDDSCEDCIHYYSRYQKMEHPSRHLLMALLQTKQVSVVYNSGNWQDRILLHLTESYETVLVCDYHEVEACKRDIVALLTEVVEIGFQQFYPFIERIERLSNQWAIHFVIREMVGE